MKPESHIVFVRHAHRDTSDREQDNGLSEKGHEQVASLVQLLKSGALPPSARFYSSPKKRCKETLEPLARFADSKIVVEQLLDEQKASESRALFLERIQKLISKFEEQSVQIDSPVYLCSHGDVIPEAMLFMTGQFHELSKGKFVQVKKKNSRWVLL